MKDLKLVQIAKKILQTVLIAGFISFITPIAAQTRGTAGKNSAPADEKFKPGDGLITDWYGVGHPPSKGVKETDPIRIFDKDGQPWLTFSHNRESPYFFDVDANPAFKAFWTDRFGRPIALRLKATSKSWYEVIVNEETQETKFIKIKDPVIYRTDFDPFIFHDRIVFDHKNNPLRKEPDGRELELEVPVGSFFQPIRIDGDWLCLSFAPINGYRQGWIRWRNDREILIGFSLNDFKIPNRK